MVGRVLAVALNTYREAVRARVLYGLLGFALASNAYAVLVASLSLHQEARVVADVGAASMSLCAIVVAIVLGATSLYRELELKTIFPILTRRLRRHEYVVGKYLGTLLVLAVFVAIDGASLLFLLALEAGAKATTTLGVLGGLLAALGAGLGLARRARVFVLVPWSALAFAAAAVCAAPGGDDRRLVLASAVLTLAEVGIVSAVALLFSSFSSPFLTAVFTFGVFLVGRSADTLASLPVKMFGEEGRAFGRVAARVVPNLHLYVPPRPLLLGHVANTPVWPFCASAGAHALFYAALLVTLAALVFRKRDFQ